MNMKKILVSLVACAVMTTAFAISAFADGIGNTLTVDTVIADVVTLSETVTVSGEVTLSGGTIIRDAEMTGPMFVVETGSKLTLENITIDGGAVWEFSDETTKAEEVTGRGSVNAGVFAGANVIENSGTVVIGESAVIRNNDGGVAVNAKNGSITTINGGEIVDITAGAGTAVLAGDTNTTALIEMKDGKISGNITGGGVFWHRGPAVVYGGEICNNYSTGSAGIFRMATGNNLSVTINGGRIHHNEANGHGGVIYAYGKSIIEINGGEISYNKAIDGGFIYGSAAKYSSLVINDGLITRNFASETAGAIHLADWWTFTLNGGEISYNETPGLGGALRQWGSWGTSFNGGIVKGNVASEGQAIWTGNGLFIGNTEFIDNDIYAADYIRLLDADFSPIELSGSMNSYVIPNGSAFEMTRELASKITVNSFYRYAYYDEEKKQVVILGEESDPEKVALLKNGALIRLKSLDEAIELASENDKIVILDDLKDKNITVNKNLSFITINEDTSSLMAEANIPVLENVIFTVEKDKSLSVDGFDITGLSYIFAKEPESVSVTNCNINVGTVEVKGTNCPPAFVLFSSSNNGSVDFTFENNTLIAYPDETEDWYTYNHGIAGWNSIEKAVIKNNTFGSKKNPLGAAAIKLMNFVDGAEVEVSGNTFYVESKDSTWGPNAIQFYQNNSRDNDYTVAISGNTFYTDDATAAIGVNVNAMGKPEQYTGGATVEITEDNKVNGKTLTITDVIVFGNGINDKGITRAYVGVGVEKDNSGKIVGGWFNPNSNAVKDKTALADGYGYVEDGAGYLKVVEETLTNLETVKVEFVKVDKDSAGNDTDENADLYDINLVADGEKIINRLNSVDLTFILTQKLGANEFEIIASNKDIAVNPVNNSEFRYEFHFNGKDSVEDTAKTITIGRVKFTGYGIYSFAVDTAANATNVAHATTVVDNIVDTFVPGGILEDGTQVGDLDIFDDTINEILIAVPTRDLEIVIDFPNAVKADNNYKYQDMKVVVSGGELAEAIVIDLGADAVMPNLVTEVKTKAKAEVAVTDKYVVTLTGVLEVNNAYNVEVSGAGYRTAKYTVTMTEDKTLNFWNNVKDNAVEVEEKKASSAKNVTFLAGDIVKDSVINIYDLSAVVSYFGEIDLNKSGEYNAYAKYDLNRDGKIDSKDVAYVLVSWGK